MTALAIEESAGEILLGMGDIPEGVWKLSEHSLDGTELRAVRHAGAFYVLGPNATSSSPLFVFPTEETGFFDAIPQNTIGTVLQKCLRACLGAIRPGTFLPPSWAPYNVGSYSIFYASTLAMGKSNQKARVIIERHPVESKHVLVCEYLGDGKAVDLHGYSPRRSATDAFLLVAAEYENALRTNPPSSTELSLRRVPQHIAIAGEFTYTKWLTHLTDDQLAFVKAPLSRPMRLRGAAGTGKTLALVMKGLHDYYMAMDSRVPFRATVVTHNWASAEAIRAAMRSLDERGAAARPAPEQHLVATTLQALASDLLQLNITGVQPISEDGFEGKVLQLEAIGSLVQEFARADWLLFKRDCSPEFSAAMTAPEHSPAARLFAWNLMNEFACVIGAQRGLAKDEYLRGRRQRWMMSLENKAEREAVFVLHERFRSFMHDGLNLLTMYDVVNDLLRFLDGNTWDVRRRKEGCDLLLVDEFHLFNKQEALVFQYLFRDPVAAPRVALALDPRQSPTETFLGLAESGRASRIFASALDTIQLNTVFRYTVEIDAFIASLEDTWFGFNLPDEWGVPQRTAVSHGAKPILRRLPRVIETIDRATAFAENFIRSREHSVAILCLSQSVFEKFDKHLDLLGRKQRCRVIRSRDDFESAVGIRGRFVLSQPEYVAGLQFDAVIIPDANDGLVGAGMDQQVEARRVVSALYLGASRARRDLILLSADEEGGILRFLKSALASGSLIQGSSGS